MWLYTSSDVLFFFFFSSRRRHTRSLCDWSSDVCSSDLNVGQQGEQQQEQSSLDHGGEEQPLRRLAELVRDHARECITGVEQVQAWGARLIADDHGDGDRLAERAPQDENHAAGDADARVWEDGLAAD